jgi:hypothetical protein
MRTLFPLTMVLACTTLGAPVPLGRDFQLGPGESARIAVFDRTVTFETVVEDSHCPSGVVCVWAGNARVRLHLTRSRQDTTVVLNTGLEPRAVRIGQIRLELREVTPAPRAGDSARAASYRITLRATGS